MSLHFHLHFTMGNKIVTSYLIFLNSDVHRLYGDCVVMGSGTQAQVSAV